VLTRRRAAAAEGLYGVVDQVDDDPPDLLDIHPDGRQAVGEAPIYTNLAEEPVVERQRFTQNGVEVRRDGAGRRHSRKLRELVHELLERLDFADDCRGALVDELPSRHWGAREVPAHALGAQLD